MTPRKRATVPPDVLRAAKLSRLPGVTIADACARFSVARPAVVRARREQPAGPLPVADLVLAALTRDGTSSEGTLSDLASIARWVDLVQHDGCTEHDVQRVLEDHAAKRVLSLTDGRWRLLLPWP